MSKHHHAVSAYRCYFNGRSVWAWQHA